MSAHLLGWTIIHSVWEGGLIVALLVVVLGMMERSSSRRRYAISVAALGLMVGAPVLTAVLLNGAHGAGLGSLGESMPFTAAARSRIDVLAPWLVRIWFLGVVAFSVRLLAGFKRTRELVNRGTRPADEWIVALAEQLMARLGVRQVIRVLESSRVQVPLVAGWLRPALLVPTSLLTGLTPYQLELILVHELAHIRRHDYIVNVCQAIAETLMFYHPGMWWLSARIRDEREHCCDDFTLAVYGGRAREYAEVLLAIEESRGQEFGFAAAANGGSLVRRVRRLLAGDASHREPRGRAMMASGGMAFSALLVGALSTGVVPAVANHLMAASRSDTALTQSLVMAPHAIAIGRLDSEPAQSIHRRYIARRIPTTHTVTTVSLSTRWQQALATITGQDGTAWIEYTVGSQSVHGYQTPIYLEVATTGPAAGRVLDARLGELPYGVSDSLVIPVGSAPSGESVALLERLAVAAPDSASEQVVGIIRVHPGDLAVAALAEVVRTGADNAVKAAAVNALGEIPLPAAVDTLRAMAGDLATPRLRNVALRSLSETPIASSAVEGLRLLALGTATSQVRQHAAQDLTDFGAPRAVPALSNIIDNTVDREVQRAAVQSLGRLLPDSAALSELQHAVWADDQRLQYRAMQQLSVHAPAIDSTWLSQVADQHPNDAIKRIAKGMLGGQ